MLKVVMKRETTPPKCECHASRYLENKYIEYSSIILIERLNIKRDRIVISETEKFLKLFR